jgi:glucose/arabinose dehydrogenase/polyisoprenoid-binding protein YceI
MAAKLARGAALVAAAAGAGWIVLQPASPPAAVAQAAATRWVVDAPSRLAFESAASGQAFEGSFGRWDADIAFDPANLAASKASVSIDIASVATGDQGRDEAAGEGTWFDLARFAKATFMTTAIRSLGGDRYVAEGTLTLRGVSKAVSLPFTLAIASDQATMAGELALNRTDFGVGQGQWQAADVVPHQVKVKIAIKAHRAGTAAAPVAAPARTAAAPAAGGKCTYSAFYNDDYRPKPAFPNQTNAPAPTKTHAFTLDTLASGIEHPWAMAFLPDGRVLVTERPGRMRIVEKNGTLSAPLQGLPPIKALGNTGLYDVTLDPDFRRNRTLYFTYFAPAPGENANPEPRARWNAWLEQPHAQREAHRIGIQKVASARLSADYRRVDDVKVLAEGGLDGRVVVAPDGKLLITAGAIASANLAVDDLPQQMDTAYGKVLRVGKDGKVPADNPYVGRAGVLPEIFASGVRDPQGAAINPWTKELWTVEHGPHGGDELNIIRKGKNYGFPRIGYGREYSNALINGGATQAPGLEQPVYFWTPSIAPTGLSFYDGKLFPNWRRSAFVGAQAGKKLVRLQLDGDKVVAQEDLLVDLCERIRATKEGPDGAVYVLTEAENGRLLRLSPARR